MGVATLTLLVGVGTPALAHHSFAMFDKNRKMTLSGTVSRFQWSNPHASVIVGVPDDKGGTLTYTLECSSPNLLGHQGWKFNTLKPGDPVSVEFYPLRDGDPGGALVSVKLPSGKVMRAY